MSVILSMFWPMFAVLAVIYIISVYMKRRNFISSLSWIPGPNPLPILGNYFDLIAIPPEDGFQTLIKYFKKYGSTFKIWIGTTPIIMCQDIDIIQPVYKEEDSVCRPAMYLMIRQFLGDGLLFGEGGDRWKSLRKYLSESFHTDILDSQLVPLSEKMHSLFKVLDKEISTSKPIDIINIFKHCFLEISISSTVGVKTNFLEESAKSNYLKGIEKMSDVVMGRFFSLILQIEPLFKFTSMKKKQEIATNNIFNSIRKCITERESTTAEISESTSKKPKIVADVMLDLMKNKVVTKAEVEDQVSNHVFASHDTLATLTAFLLFQLANHLDVQEEVHKELDRVCPNILTEGMNLKESNNLQLLDRCIKETLRMFPPAILMGRRIIKPIITKKGIVPAGVDLYVNMYNYHRNPEYYTDPDKFNPDRFLPENMKERNPLHWIPFGLGSRICIGQKQAMIQSRVAAAMILKKYSVKSFEEEKDLKLSANVIIKSKNGVRVYLKQRDLS